MHWDNQILPVILCGGSGSRLWPLSRKSLPKQYLKFKSDFSFLQLTLLRLLPLKTDLKPILVCNQEHRFITAEQVSAINLEPHSIILEPCSRNTAPAIALAAIKAMQNGEDPILLILPSDHLIIEEEKMLCAIKKAAEYAIKGKLVTFGIVPSGPETKYGYIKAQKTNFNNQSDASKIELFIEKPDKQQAKNLIKDNSVCWNSGIFVFKASSIINEIKKYYPEIFSHCKTALEDLTKDLDFERITNSSFEKCESISIDDAVMEKTNIGMVIPLKSGWSDIGGWKSFWENYEKDLNGNLLIGDTLEFSSQNCLMLSEDRFLVGLGIKDLIVVETRDSVLIANKEYSEKVKDIVNILKRDGRLECDDHKTVFRPWGNFTSIENGNFWKVKKLEVKPGESLSLQTHHYRSEHWVVVEGEANVQIDKKKFILNANESCYIPPNTLHRLSNISDNPLVIIETQTGSYLGEDDIKRFDDKYGRILN